jgi:hypothetical protein
MNIFSVFFEEINHNYLDNQINISVSNFIDEYEYYQEKHYFNGEKSDVIAEKLNKHLKGVLKDKGTFITEYSLSVGMDPYLATSVMLHETGCAWTCSKLARTCNNVGGNKGKPGCNGGSYRKFNTIEEGIKFAIDKLNSYYQKGYTTPKQINPYYAADKTWYVKINNYINKLKK